MRKFTIILTDGTEIVDTKTVTIEEFKTLDMSNTTKAIKGLA